MSYEVKISDGSLPQTVAASAPAVITLRHASGHSESASVANKVEIPNETTRKVMAETDAGRNIVRCKDGEDLFRRLGI
jgi:hypothetical protein